MFPAGRKTKPRAVKGSSSLCCFALDKYLPVLRRGLSR